MAKGRKPRATGKSVTVWIRFDHLRDLDELADLTENASRSSILGDILDAANLPEAIAVIRASAEGSNKQGYAENA